MSRLISRLKEIIEKYNAGCYNETCNPFESCTDCVLKQIREVIESQPPADSGPDTNVGTNQWIPCSERLPKKNGRYLVTQKRYPIDDNKHEKLLSIETDYAEFSVSENKWRRANMFEVTAWMDAEPYKEE